MSQERFDALGRLCWIEHLPGRRSRMDIRVRNLVEERQRDLERLPREASNHLHGCILDIGPGEGISSMALARLERTSDVCGIEMDADHLALAWPDSVQYSNLRLAWGSPRGMPSNPRVAPDSEPPPVVSLPPGCCDVLVTWLGMSRTDIFGAAGWWALAARRASVLVYPRFWRAGTDDLTEASAIAWQRSVTARASDARTGGRSVFLAVCLRRDS